MPAGKTETYDQVHWLFISNHGHACCGRMSVGYASENMLEVTCEKCKAHPDYEKYLPVAAKYVAECESQGVKPEYYSRLPLPQQELPKAS